MVVDNPPDDPPIPPDDPPIYIPPDDPPIPPGYFDVQFPIAITSKYRHKHSIRTLNQIDAAAFLCDDEERMMDVRDFVDMPGSAYRLLKENPLDSFFLKEINIGDGTVEVWISTSNSSTTFILDQITFIKSYDENSEKFLYKDPDEGTSISVTFWYLFHACNSCRVYI